MSSSDDEQFEAFTDEEVGAKTNEEKRNLVHGSRSGMWE